ncbi:hypothetical protein [Nocardia sp. NPDC050710]|uniref:hypothetical protein n=1 Tax=Nocardia sp. NPDC050710 TaxID=3157220 RepID=UPI0033C58BC1
MTNPEEPIVTESGDRPVGLWQQVGFLLASIAVRRTGVRVYHLGEKKRGMSAEEFGQQLLEMVAAAEERLRLTDVETAGREEISDRLVDALVWRGESDLAAQMLQRLTRHFEDTYGVTISPGEHPEDSGVSLLPGYSAGAVQLQVTASAAWKRQEAAVVAAIEILDAADLSDQDALAQAITNWHGDRPNPWLDEATLRARRSELERQLTATGVDDRVRADLLFVVDYLTARPVGGYLQQTSVMVDPGDEVKGRMQVLLDVFARNPKAARAMMSAETAVLVEADQEAVREEGRQILRGHQPASPWPEYIDRDMVGDRLHRYAEAMQHVIDYARYLATDPDAEIYMHETGGSYDEIFDILDIVRDERAHFTAMAEQRPGLVEIERQQLKALLRDFDVGISTQLPELLWADDRSKREADYLRGSQHASTLSQHVEQQMKAVLTAAGVTGLDKDRLHVPSGSVAFELSRIRDWIYMAGTNTDGDSDAGNRERRNKSVAACGQALVTAGVPQPARAQVKAILDAGFADAERFSGSFRIRMQRWTTRSAHTSAKETSLPETAAATGARPLIEAAGLDSVSIAAGELTDTQMLPNAATGTAATDVGIETGADL